MDASYDVIVLGGGAAGLMTALTAGRRGRRVLLLEHNERVGRKIEISGGGRCNFTNVGAGPEHYRSSNPDFCRSALSRFTPWDFLAMVEQHGIRYHEKKLGQQFCDGSSREIVEMLLTECARARVLIQCGSRIAEVEHSDVFRVSLENGATVTAASLIVATGGLSLPKLGATDFGYRLGRKFGHSVLETRAGLVPLTYTPDTRHWAELSGLAVPVVARCGGGSFGEAMLFTHRGLSGPAILQVSSYWHSGEAVEVDLLPGLESGPWLEAGRLAHRDLTTLLAEHWPRRFAEAWVKHEAGEKPLGHRKNRELSELSQRLHAWTFRPGGTEGYATAEVTLGGIDTRELNPRTMESRLVSGLFFVGECVDVTGWLGGYNFQWAWASGHAAGSAC